MSLRRDAALIFASSIIACTMGCGSSDDAASPGDAGGDDAQGDATNDASNDEVATDAPSETATDARLDARDADNGDAPDTGGCPSGPFGGGVFPPACYRPFLPSSPFNTKLPSAPKIASNSAAVVRRVLSIDTPIAPGSTQPANLVAYSSHDGGWPTYWSVAKDPTFNLECDEFGGACSIAASGLRVHVPAGAILQGGCGAATAEDRHMTIVDQESGWEYDLWHVSTCPIPATGGTIKLGWGGRARMDGDGRDTDGGEGMASYFANLAGRVRAEELAAHKIDHALSIVIDCDDGTFVFPAKAHDKKCADTFDAPPMGARFQLDLTSAEIDALPSPAWKKALLHAMAEYGMFFGDTGSTFFFDVQTEGGRQYVATGVEDAWLLLAKSEGWSYYEDPALGASDPYKGYVGTMHNGDDGIDWKSKVWSHVRMIDPCVSAGTCP